MIAIIKFSGDPLINISGAYFPAWLACMIAGLLGTWISAIFFGRCGLTQVMNPPGLMIPSLFAAITLWVWIFYFAAQ
ncbi:MAG TPA: YtcA family lipoprotein [Chthoniobacterales bacterium]|nr:YtcA family lipoprotein [Chthoniobacterales bacterium]